MNLSPRQIKYIQISLLIFAILLCNLAFKLKTESFTERKNIQDITYVINLEKRPQRHRHFLNLYSNSDLKGPLRTIEAVDGSLLDLQNEKLSENAISEIVELSKVGHRTKHYQLTKGAIGCYHSHINTWKTFINKPNDINTALIFEDDAKIPPNLQAIINNDVVLAPPDWDVILLGVACHSCTMDLYSPKFQKVNRFWLLHSYLITRQGAKKILDSGNLFPITQQIDSLLSDMSGKLNIYALKSNPVKQVQFKTDIQAPIKRVKGVDPMTAYTNQQESTPKNRIKTFKK